MSLSAVFGNGVILSEVDPKRRRFLKKGFGFFLLSLGGFGLFSAIHLIPRPPKRVLLKEKPKEGEILVHEAFFLKMTKKGPLALSRRCPHLGCPVTYDPEEKQFVCPCHQSRFSLEGKYLSGPAKKDLFRLTVRETEGGLIVEIPG